MRHVLSEDLIGYDRIIYPEYNAKITLQFWKGKDRSHNTRHPHHHHAFAKLGGMCTQKIKLDMIELYILSKTDCHHLEGTQNNWLWKDILFDIWLPKKNYKSTSMYHEAVHFNPGQKYTGCPISGYTTKCLIKWAVLIRIGSNFMWSIKTWHWRCYAIKCTWNWGRAAWYAVIGA